MKKVSLMDKAMALTTANIVKGRGASGKTTYLDRIVANLLDEDGNPGEPKTRTQIIGEVSLEIAIEANKTALEAGTEGVVEFDLENEDHIAEFKAINLKVKPMVAAAVSNSNNSTALSYNDKYKNVWQVVKEGNTVALAAIEAAAE